jgi:hypothetical protein
MTTSRTDATTCTRCGRVLTSAISIARGYGRTCRAKVIAAAKVADHKPAQIAKAQELIELGGIVPLRSGRTRVFVVVSTSGTGRYLTAPQACNCAAGLKGRSVCYHRIAAQLIAA